MIRAFIVAANRLHSLTFHQQGGENSFPSPAFPLFFSSKAETCPVVSEYWSSDSSISSVKSRPKDGRLPSQTKRENYYASPDKIITRRLFKSPDKLSAAVSREITVWDWPNYSNRRFNLNVKLYLFDGPARELPENTRKSGILIKCNTAMQKRDAFTSTANQKSINRCFSTE